MVGTSGSTLRDSWLEMDARSDNASKSLITGVIARLNSSIVADTNRTSFNVDVDRVDNDNHARSQTEYDVADKYKEQMSPDKTY